jgi:hypothetical protein
MRDLSQGGMFEHEAITALPAVDRAVPKHRHAKKVAVLTTPSQPTEQAQDASLASFFEDPLLPPPSNDQTNGHSMGAQTPGQLVTPYIQHDAAIVSFCICHSANYDTDMLSQALDARQLGPDTNHWVYCSAHLVEPPSSSHPDAYSSYLAYPPLQGTSGVWHAYLPLQGTSGMWHPHPQCRIHLVLDGLV